MPELPDLHVFSRNLHARLAGRVVCAVKLWKTGRRNFSDAKLAGALEGQILEEIHREGKEVHFRFANGHRLGVHLMLAGQFDLVSDPDAVRFARLGLLFERGEWLVVSDPRAWVTFALNPKPTNAPDALSPQCDAEYLCRRMRECPGITIKRFLLDQLNLRGIGNAYADEILWACRIAPRSLCDFFPEARITDLHRAIHMVLTEAVAEIERLAPNAINGEMRDFLKIHNPAKTHSPTGLPIRCDILDQKKTYYCADQKLYGDPMERVASEVK